MGEKGAIRNRLGLASASLLVAACACPRSAHAGSPTSMVIISAAQTLAVGKCSTATIVQAQDASRAAANVRSKTRIYFNGSSAGLSFFQDSACSIGASNGVVMQAGTNRVSFYFKSNSAGSKKIAVSTYNYNDDQQYENIVSAPPSPSPSPTRTPSPSPSPSVTPSPSPTQSSPGTMGRAIPAPIYGVTLDDVSNVSGEVTSLSQLAHMPTARVVFDYGMSPSYYSGPIQQLGKVSYIMGQIADSSDMKKFTAASYQTRALDYLNTLGSMVDVWEIGNEVNGDWLGIGMMSKIEAAYDAVSAAKGTSAITFFYEGEPSDPKNCIATANGGNDMFTWIKNNFQLNLSPSQRSAESEKVRLGTQYILVSWYPDQCNNIQPNWTSVFTQLAAIFPNSKVGFGEIGAVKAQGGSTYEVKLINQFYPMAQSTPLPASYIGGYFWWYYAEEMVPATNAILFNELNHAIY
ncbi:MAG: hypothetical protein ACJ763_13030 [Bdellovibrionia bacterium]